MKKALKKAFTLVELLVVIAIIAVLSVAGIVGYSVFTKKAEISNDESLVAQLNELMKGYEALNGGKVLQPNEAIAALEEEGFDLAKLHTAYKNHRIIFDPSTCQFLLIENGDVNYPEGAFLMVPEPSSGATREQIKAQLEAQMGGADIGLYIPDNAATTLNAKFGTAESLDVTDSVDSPRLTTILNYADNKEETVTINCGNDEGLSATHPLILSENLLEKLTIDNPNATVNHYGFVQGVEVKNVKEYHCYAERWGDFTISGGGTYIFEKGSARNVSWTYNTNGYGEKERRNNDSTKIFINSPSGDISGERNITIEFNETIDTPNTVTINVINAGNIDNLKIINKGGTGAIKISHKGTTVTVNKEDFSGSVSGGKFTESGAAAAAYIANPMQARVSADDVVAYSNWKNGATEEGYYEYTAEEFAGWTTNPIYGENCVPGGETEVHLTQNATLSTYVIVGYVGMTSDLNISFYLDGYELTFQSGTQASYLMSVQGSEQTIELSIFNGSIVGNNRYNTFDIYRDCILTFDNINYKSGYYAINLAQGRAEANVRNRSVINADTFCIGSNANNVSESCAVTVENSDLSATSSAVLFNVPGTLSISHGSASAVGQAVFARAGTVILDTVELTLLDETEDPLPVDFFDYRIWDQGNRANYGALVLGDKSASANYQHPVTATVTNCTFVVKHAGFPAIYVWSNNTPDAGVTLNYSNCTFTDGNIVLGGYVPTMQFNGSALTAAQQEYFADNYGLFNLLVNGVSYAGQQGPIIIDPNASQE